MAIGAYAVERDYSHYVAYASKTVLAVVGTASKGPIGEVTVVTSTQDLVNKFGPLKADYYGLYASQYFLSQASKMYFVRAAGDSVAASKVKIAGAKANEETIEESVVFEFIEKGTFSNGYLLTVGESETSGSYTLTLKNSAGVTVEVIKDIPLESLVVGYATKLLKVTTVNATVATLTAGTYTFSGGNDGLGDIDSGDYTGAADELLADTLDVNLISVPGVSDINVINHVISIVENRGDCFYLIDPPKGLTKEGVVQWSKGGGSYDHSAISSSYAALYFDWVNIYDSVNKINVQVPPSVVVATTYAYSDRISDLWYAPAGLTRGIIRGVYSTVTKLNKTDTEFLYDNNINAIYDDPQVGPVLWGQKTLDRQDIATNRVNVRRLMNYLKRVVTAACAYLVFEPNDRITWNSFEMKIIPTLDSIKTRRGIYSYSIVKGETIVSDEDIDNYRMPCMVMIRPTKSAEEIPIYFVITSTGADFNEVLESNGIVND